jgi:hypothetical protein
MDAISERLEASGYRRAEGGDRGRVFLCDGTVGHVVKLFPDDDLAYLSFVRYVLDHPSEHLPRVLHGPVEVESGWGVVLERLDEPDPEAAGFYLDEAEGFLLDVVNGDRTDAAPVPVRWGEGLGTDLRATLLGIGRTLLLGHGFIPDGSGGNVLMRAGVPVLSDVVCGRSGREYHGGEAAIHGAAYASLFEEGPAPSP